MTPEVGLVHVVGRQNPSRWVIRRVQRWGVAGVVWTVREGKPDYFGGPVVVSGYRSRHPVREPGLGEVLRLTDDARAWRVVDWKLTNSSASPGNVLVVESFGD